MPEGIPDTNPVNWRDFAGVLDFAGRFRYLLPFH
jgi:hypothetical protein